MTPAYFFFSNSVNKNYFTLNASADLSALWVICRVAAQPTELCYRAICEQAPKAQ